MATKSVISKNIAESSSTYVGVNGELILDTATNTLKVSDGSTAGGVTLTTDGGGGVTASSTTTFTNKSGAISQWTNDSTYLSGSAASIAPQQINASGDVNARNLAMGLKSTGLLIGGQISNGDDTTYRIIFEANTAHNSATQIFAKRPANGQDESNFWFPKFNAGTRYIVTTSTTPGSDAGTTGNLDTWFGDITFDGNTISTGSSNADLELDASGTGRVVLKAPLSLLTSQPDGSSAAIDITTNVAFLDGNSNSSEKMNYTLANGTYVGQFVQLVRNSGTFDSINVTARMLGSNGTESSSQVEVFSQYDSIRIFIWSGTAWVSTRGGGHP